MKRFALIVILLVCFGTPPLNAGVVWPGEGPRLLLAQGGMSLDQAVRQAQRRSGGRVLSANTVGEGARRVHVVKVLTPDHKVRTFRFDAGPGR